MTTQETLKDQVYNDFDLPERMGVECRLCQDTGIYSLNIGGMTPKRDLPGQYCSCRAGVELWKGVVLIMENCDSPYRSKSKFSDPILADEADFLNFE